MKDEIKEILDRAKKLKDKCSCCEQIGEDIYISKYHEIETQNLIEAVYIIDKLLDYITNLQEENDILKRDIEAMKHNYNLLVRLIENGESMTQKFENGLTYQDYKSRNEKAIEYIGNGNIGIPKKTRDKFIAILKGEDNTPEKGFRLVGDDNE